MKTSRDCIELNGSAGTVALRQEGRQRRRTFRADGQTRLMLTTKATVEYQGRQRAAVVEIDTESGSISVRLEGIRKRKTYLASDLYTWGEQLQLL
jgi:hypothetical protein